ncbi:MAG: ABC transporter ATP-binding protein [Deltaproteobacteria bacterium]|nr:ABC transporter ATP-binding protein [Deltaproteobacteria bacterium]MBW2015760.1 ABC transporter ATP-binding protein [Deltaproteobacteria bacterium]MBW2302723.1 ABC transporter ATP-binding protein [Deltaproteobacteria bacterium]
MNERPKPLLEIQDLHTRFHTMDGVVSAVDGVDFEVYSGETLGLVGESGCGKSVTALSILRLLRCPPAEIKGRILFEGENLLELDREKIRKIRGNDISMIFQEPMTSLNPVLKVGEQIAEAARLHKAMNRPGSWRWAVEMLRRVQIPEPDARSRQYPHKFSGGMRQRAMIAMALSCNPRLILADEPTTALDVTIQAQIMALLQQLKDEFNTAILLITHDLGVIAEMASRVIVMYAGKVVEEAPVKDLFRDPRHPYTQGLLGSIPVIGRKEQTGRRLQEISGIVPSPNEMPSGCRFHPRCSEAMDRCRRQEPPMTRLGEHRRVNCWLQAEVS